jgi:repressor LexA
MRRDAMEILTDREREILAFIRDASRIHGFPPSIRELGLAFGIQSTNGVRYYLRRLEEKGYIKRNPRISRGIVLNELAVEAVLGDPVETGGLDAIFERGGIPLLGRVAAGAPILAEENVEDVLFLDGFVAHHRDLFALRVRGDSMQNAGILDGDVVVVRSQSDARNGDIVVALLDDEATCKRFHRTGEGVALLPENPAYEPILLSAEAFSEVKVLGKVTAVLRRYA